MLEHLERPGLAIERLMRALAPRGLLVVAVPTRWSLKGLAARLTPFAVHRAFYRSLIGDTNEGVTKQDQYRTYLRLEMDVGRLRRLAIARGLAVLIFRTYEGPVHHALRARYRAAHALCGALGWISRVASRGRLDVTRSDAIIVLSKAESEQRRTQYQVTASMARS